jgi:hypothetical protein
VQTNLRFVLLTAVIAIAGLAGIAPDVAAPRPLYAQQCGAYDGKLCAQDCGKECSNGSCCGWSFYYYKNGATIEIQ